MALANEAVRRLALGAVLCLGLAGCGAGTDLDGAFGAQDTGVSGGSPLNAAGGAGGPPPRDPAAPLTVGTGQNMQEYECPRVTVRSGASSWQVQGTGGALKSQANLGMLARECSINGDTLRMRVGIEGRVILGEQGKPGEIRVPIRLAVVREGPEPKTITTKFFVTPVNVPPNEQQAGFTVVEEDLSFPLAKPSEIERYVVYVGFDPKGETERPRTTTRPKPAAPKPAASAPAAAAPKPAATTPAATAPKPATTTTTTAPAQSTAPAASSSSSSGAFGNPAAARDPFGPPPNTFSPPPIQ